MVVNRREITAPVFLTVNVLSSDPEWGEAQGGGVFLLGSQVTVTASPLVENAVFLGWRNAQGETVSTEQAYTLLVTEDITLTAVFTRQWVVTAAALPPEGGTVQGGGTFLDGATAAVSAETGEGYLFSGWRDEAGELLSSDPDYAFPVHRDMALSAGFALLCTVVVTANLPEGGAPAGAGKYPYGASVTVQANPGPGYLFTGWKDEEGNVVSQQEAYTFTITGDVALQAEYEAHSRLPEGYQEVQYLHTPNGGYFYTVGLPNNVAPLKLSFKAELGETAGDMMGSSYNFKRSRSVSGRWVYDYICYGWYLEYTPAPNRKLSLFTRSIYITNSSVDTQYTFTETELPIGEENLIEVIADIPSHRITVNGVEAEIPAYTNRVNYPNVPFAVFARNHSTGTSSTPGYQPINMKLYSLTAEDPSSKETVAELVPCVNAEGAPGLYDVANDHFYSGGKYEAGPSL